MKKTGNTFSREAVMKVLFENYEVIYDVDMETSEYICYHESDSFSELQIEMTGEDFFSALETNVPKMIYPEDVEYVKNMTSKEVLLERLGKSKFYSFTYRLLIDGKPVYHKLRATAERIGGHRHVFLGVRNVEETIRQERMHLDTLESMYQKEKNHMAAILASAAGYLEVNLTKDLVLEKSLRFLENNPNKKEKAYMLSESRYTAFEKWICERYVVENAKRYLAISDREYLIDCFEKGEMRASVSFSFKAFSEVVVPSKKLIFLYKDNASGDIFAFCVIYDLTEHQRREREMRQLENELHMSRIRNFTSQMQPHFLYNTLGSIQEIMLDDPKYASRLLGDFTIHLRSCIRAMANDAPLSFDQELDNIRAYVNIEKMRFGDKLKVQYDIKISDFQILPLSIQPLVENAIRHGIYQRGMEGGTVTIRTYDTREARVVEVEDNGVGFDVKKLKKEITQGKRDSTGLKNIIFRLDKVMHAGVDIQSTPGKGTKISVFIPKGGIL